MTDPIYGDSPLDPEDRWYETMRPPLVNDPELLAWAVTVTGAIGDLNESSWLVRWRTKSVVTAAGVHLNALGRDLGFLRPVGWDDTRYQKTLIPIDGAVFTNRPVRVTRALAVGLAVDAQVWEMTRGGPLTYVVYFFSLSDDEAKTYYDVLERGRPTAVRFVLVYSNVTKAETFVLDVSELDGTAVLAKMI